VESIPSRVITSTGQLAPPPEPAPSRFFAPSATSPGLAPSVTGRPPRHGSALRFLSTSQRFPGTPGLRGLVSCRSRPWVLPSELCSSPGSRPSRGRQLPCSSPPPYLRCDARGTPPAFTDARALARWPDPTEARPSFQERCDPPRPRRLDPAHRGHPVPTASSASKPLPPRSRPIHRSGFPSRRRAMLSWALPLQSLPPTVPRALSPNGFSPAAGLAPAAMRRATPHRQVTSLRPHDRDDVVGARPAFDRGPERAASRRQPCLPRP